MDNRLISAVKIYLLPRKFRLAGYILTAIGLLLGYIRFSFGLKLKLLNIKVFALFSAYFENKYFAVIENNFTEEASAVLLLTGLLFVALSEEKNENRLVQIFRLKAMLSSVYIEFVLCIISIIFVFGLGFIEFLALNLFLPLFVYIIISRYYFLRYKNEIANFSEKQNAVD